MIFSWSNTATTSPNVNSLIWILSGSDADIATAVTALKARPPGQRALHLGVFTHAIFEDTRDNAPTLAWPNGIGDATALALRIFGAIHAAGATVDVFSLDNESAPSWWTLDGQTSHFTAINAIATANGLPTLPLTTEADINAFNAGTAKLSDAAIDQSIVKPAQRFFPNAIFAGFGDQLITAGEASAVPEINGHPAYYYTIAGTVQSPGLYGTPGLFTPTTAKYTAVEYAVSILRRAMKKSPVWPWYAGDNVDSTGVWAGSPYYAEYIRHALLTCGVQGFLFDAGQPTTTAQTFASIVDEFLSIADGAMSNTVVVGTANPASPDAALINYDYFATARVGENGPNRIFGRVTVKEGWTGGVATFTIADKIFNVEVPSGETGAWFMS